VLYLQRFDFLEFETIPFGCLWNRCNIWILYEVQCLRIHKNDHVIGHIFSSHFSCMFSVKSAPKKTTKLRVPCPSLYRSHMSWNKETRFASVTVISKVTSLSLILRTPLPSSLRSASSFNFSLDASAKQILSL
jgi:hypothetical protein